MAETALADRAAVRYSVLTVGVAACVLVAVPLVPWLHDDRAMPACALSSAERPVPAAVALGTAFALWVGIACMVGRLLNAAVGLFVLGCGAFAAAGRCGTIADAAFGGTGLLPMAVETLVLSAVALGASAAVFAVSGPLPDMPARSPRGPFRAEVFNVDALRSMAAGLLSVAAMWLVCRTDMKGQAVFGAALGGVATAFAARRMLAGAQPILLMAAPVLAVGLAQLWTALTMKAALDQAVALRALPGWSTAMPLDVVAGTLMGVPFGLGWSKPSESGD
jgi:hypothetical protein